MTDNLKQLTREEMFRLLGKLDVELFSHGERAIVYVVGGANIAMAVDASRTTTDIHVVVKRGLSVVFEAAKRVAATEPGLGDDWINAQFTNNTYDGGMTWPQCR